MATLRYIDVVGSSRFIPEPDKFRVQVQLFCKKRWGQNNLDKSFQFRTAVIDGLIKEGLKRTQIEDAGGGNETYYLRKADQITYTLILHGKEQQKLVESMRTVDQISQQMGQEFSFKIISPTFRKPEDAYGITLREAIAKARLKAETIASEAELKIVNVIHVIEQQKKSSPSNSSNQEDWPSTWGDDEDLMLGKFAAADVGFTETSANLTPLVIRCEVRFEVAPLKE